MRVTLNRLVGPLLAAPLVAALAAPLGAQERMTFDHLRRVVNVGAPAVSADGRTAAILVTRPNYVVNRSETRLWSVPLAGGTPRLLTPSRTSVSSPQWAPVGRDLAFLAPDSAGRAQLWVLPGEGGEARQVTSHPTPVQHYSWRPDGQAIAFAAEDEEPRREGEARFVTSFDIGASDLFLRRNVRPQHAWLVTVATGESRRLTRGTWSLQFSLPPGGGASPLSWSPDGSRLALVQGVSAETGKMDSTRIAVLDVASGELRGLTGMRTGEGNARWSPDGRHIAFVQNRDRTPGALAEVYVVEAAGGTPRSLTRALDRHILRAEWMADGSGMLVAAADQATMGVWVQPLSGPASRVALGDLVLTGGFGADIARTASGAYAFTATTAGRPSELYAMDGPTSAPRRLTNFNDWIGAVGLGRVERVTWRTDGFEADGIVTYPPGFDAARRYPLVLVIHGGPTSSSKASFNSLPQLIAAEGAIVFEPNYRGSDNLGNAFQAAIQGDAGKGPGRDVMAGVKMLRARPYVDASRTIVTGWSYGGYMTTWMIGNYPKEWTAALAGAPVTDFEDQYNYGDGNIRQRNRFGGSPWTGARAAYQAQSPITYADKIVTPTLIVSHMEDFRVPPTQAMRLYRALQDRGIESRFIGFPGRTHNPTDPVMGLERTKIWVTFVKERLQPTVTP